MNCDQVFEVLTCCTPVNEAASDVQVEQHLSCCPSCRCLAEKIGPAVALFDNVYAADSTKGAARTVGLWQPLFDEEACEVRPCPDDRLYRITTVRPAEQPRTVDYEIWRLAVAILIGLGIGIMAAGFAVSGAWQSNQLADSAGESLSTAALPREIVSSLGLAAACLPTVDNDRGGDVQASPVSAVQNETPTIQLACCTQCHRATAQTAGRWATSHIANACQVCHIE